MSYPSEKIRVTPLLVNFSTLAATSLIGKTRLRGHGDFSVLCGVLGGTVSTARTATAACKYDFSVIESTAASAAGSAISGATMTLGAATALTLRGAVNAICKVATNLATTVNLTVNGLTYHISTAGATAKNGAVALAEALNGGCTGATAVAKVPHYSAIHTFASANLVLLTADDDQGTGLTITTVTGGVQVFQNHLQGVIDVQLSKLSTNSPKYIGVACTTHAGATGVRYAQLLSRPSAGPAMPGSKVSCTT